MRAAFSNALVRLAKSDPRIVLLTGDHGYALFDDFRKHCPGQYFNAGIAEQNMVGMAAGLAKGGFIPFVYGLAAFVPIRVLEQIKLDIAHDNLPVVLLGDGAGFVYSHLGTSHQSTEDIAATRAIPNLTVLSPSDRYEQTLCMEWAYESKSSVYLRMGKSDRGDVHLGPLPRLPIGTMFKVREGSHGGPTFIATGSMVTTALKVANQKYSGATVWSVPSIKPIDALVIAQICAGSSYVAVFEEHNIYGGLGSLVAEISTEQAPCRVLRLGVNDRFSDSCGTYDYLLKEHEIDVDSIILRIEEYTKRISGD